MEKLKVFLVEDEFVVREGIKNNIKWQEHGYDFCGEAGDGELAFSMIQKLKPDIVITDIRMPFMDGLVLSKLIKKEMPWIEIIILTGYAEFEYAKEAIRVGVAEYLTKPINSEELLKEVDGLADKIMEKRKERELRERYKKEMEENLLKEKKELFQYLVTGAKSLVELLEMADKLHINLSSMWHNIVLIKMRFRNQTRDEYSNTLLEIEEKISAIADESKVIYFERNLEGKALLFKADSKEELEMIQNAHLHQLKSIWEEYENIYYFGGIGVPVNRLRELPSSFEAANHAFAHRYLVQGCHILNSTEIVQRAYLDKSEFSLGNVNPKQIDNGRMREFLKTGDKEEVVYFIEEFFNALDTNAMQSHMFRQYITMDSYFCVADFVEGLQFARGEIESPDQNASTLQTKENAIAYIVRIMTKALELRESAVSNQYGDVVDEVKKYIEDNYADDQISLNLLASHVNFSPNHLSTVFSQYTGQTFTRYLTDYRMNKAKELLRCTGKRSSEISRDVGYKDSHYFSYLFKKTQDMTPTQYRNEGRAEGGDQ